MRNLESIHAVLEARDTLNELAKTLNGVSTALGLFREANEDQRPQYDELEAFVFLLETALNQSIEKILFVEATITASGREIFEREVENDG